MTPVYARARARAWLFVQVLRASAWPVGPALAALAGAALVGLGLWAAAAAVLQEERDAALQGRAQLQAQLHSLRAQLAQTPEPGEGPPSGTASDAGPTHAWRGPQTAHAAGLQLEQWQAARTGSPDASVQLRLRGPYHAHRAWVALLAADPAAPALLSYQLQAAEGGLLAAEVRMQPWAGIVPQSPAASLAQRPAVHRDPFGAAPPAPEPQLSLPPHWRAQWQRPRKWLEGAPLEDFEFTGTLRRGEHWAALLRWERMVHTVRVGDTLGQQRAQVLRIDEHGLWLRELRPAEGGRWQEAQRHWRVGERP